MSIDVMTKVIQRAPVVGSRFTCMLVMANWSNDDGDSLYPSMDLLAEAMRVSRSQAKRVLRSLMPAGPDDEAAGNWWFRVVGNEKGGAPGMTRRYEMNVARLDAFPLLPEFEKAAERRRNKRETGRTNAPPVTRQTGRMDAPPNECQTGRIHAPPRGAPMRPDSSEETSVEKGAHAMDAFDRALKAWPSGAVDSRKDALKAWRALSLEDRVEASSEIGRFVLTNKSAGRTMICSFASYLGERKWKALPDRPKPATTTTAAPARPAVKQPSKFQLQRPDLYPEIFRDQAAASTAGEATP